MSERIIINCVSEMKPMDISTFNDSLTNAKTETDKELILSGIVSSLAYASTSISMVLINKFVATSIDAKYRENIPNLAVIWVQCLVAILILEFCRIARLIEYPGLEWDIVKVWLPVNLIFVCMLSTGFLTFIYLSVPMINIMKNLTNVITIIGDWILYKEM